MRQFRQHRRRWACHPALSVRLLTPVRCDLGNCMPTRRAALIFVVSVVGTVCWRKDDGTATQTVRSTSHEESDRRAILEALLRARLITHRKTLVVPETLRDDPDRSAMIRRTVVGQERELMVLTHLNRSSLDRMVIDMTDSSAPTIRLSEANLANTTAVLMAGPLTDQLRQGARAKCKPCDADAVLGKHPGEDELIWLSRPGVVDRFALVYSETACGDLCGEGALSLLENVDGRWTVRKRFAIWAS